ncbi:MAG: hypothetical protein CM1200mP28_14200 [Deltaproteobacteria bacterium]|nr:MAG: hypothetical protein CM1200mP28_14200 [Deltaproteobacteria bacterium]
MFCRFFKTGDWYSQAPSNQIVMGIALFLSLFVMMPVWEEVNEMALGPYLDETISQQEFMDRLLSP